METEDHNLNNAAQILIVEDSPTQAERLKFILERHGYLFSAARNGREALAAIQERVPALVISDIVMPEMDGYQLCGHLKKDERFKRIPVILLTSLSDPIDVVKGLECGADNFILKPYDEKYLLNRITYMLANRHLRENDITQMGVEIFFSGSKFFITSDRLQILNLLLSTYEAAVQRNRELVATRDELRQLNENLEAAVRANQLIMEHSIDVICTIDGEGKFIFVSPACERLWGYKPEELVGRPCFEFVHSEDHLKTKQAAMDVMTGQSLRDFENRYIRKDGSLIPVVWSTSWSAADQLMFCVAHDITERKRSEETLHRAHDELHRANVELGKASRHKDEFLANMSHELRTPLNSILGLSEALLEQNSGALTPRQVKSLTTISTSGTHLLALINDILDLSKIEAGKQELQIEPLEVEEFCQECLVFVRTQAIQKNIAIAFEPDRRATKFVADPKRFKQVLVNLLTNAVKFTPNGGRVGLMVTAPQGEGVVRFTVWDTGIGIASMDAAKLFQAFSQIDSGLTRTQEGTGLGLALVAKLVELHGGSVALESEPGHGSRFSVTLPLPSEGRAAGQASSRDPFSTVSRSPKLFRRALIIEDDPTTSDQLERYLAELELSSVVQADGEAAVAVALRERPDVILLDILLPRESGWVVLARLKEHPGTQQIPVVVISVVDEPQKSRALGAAAHFTKPITRAQLAGFLQRATVEVSQSTSPFVEQVPASVRGPLILLAEDNEANIETLGGYLKDKGYAMHYATNGLVAVKLARAVRPALILMDIQMPVMDGLTAIREIRADADLKAIPIVALTALAMPGDRERCLVAGATDYMSKPVRLKALAALVARLLPATALNHETPT